MTPGYVEWSRGQHWLTRAFVLFAISIVCGAIGVDAVPAFVLSALFVACYVLAARAFLRAAKHLDELDRRLPHRSHHGADFAGLRATETADRRHEEL